MRPGEIEYFVESAGIIHVMRHSSPGPVLSFADYQARSMCFPVRGSSCRAGPARADRRPFAARAGPFVVLDRFRGILGR